MSHCLQEPSKIHEGVFAIVRKVGGEQLRLCRLISGQRVLIERLSFDPKNTIGHFYGMFEVSGGGDTLCPVQYNSIPIVIPHESTNGTRKRRHEDECNQQLTGNQIMSLKEGGITTDDLVSKLVNGNSSFQSRTKFSKEKYMRKKAQKHSDRIIVLKPNIRLLSKCYYRKDPERLGHLRIDQLGLMLQLSGLHSGQCNAFVFDQVLGLLGAAVLERISSHGHCIFVHRGDWPQSIPCLELFSSDKQKLNGLLTLRITTLMKSDVGLSRTDSQRNAEGEEMTVEEPTGEEEDDKGNKDGELLERREQQLQKRLEREEGERRAMEIIRATEEDGGKVDSICMAIRTVDPVDILQKVYKGLRLSGTVAFLLQHLLNAWKWLKSVGSAVDIQLSQQFFRSHQVLSNRTHPIMQQHVSGGYVLYAIKVLPPEPHRIHQRTMNKEMLVKHSRVDQ
uniref:tRNA (adenine(58)-N(1))-methyltransferase non-catalytic subunit TRM6 n=1 Tax=Globodera pallida TaxID=36090 RepID=A0A183BVQ1_GLOPA